eukprot:CAMPEP_0117672162 /NCGR_PEP_ID=MMETSP0804-20121206/13747_1 /TAXON_ID=1074897 /ORGANISM="Tetraselmis astigmatica, Strain CCMP880" /LENGTH=46 /DNA_ID= /DNA_START= /DNA_END= /DNA_ORIENTATION=
MPRPAGLQPSQCFAFHGQQHLMHASRCLLAPLPPPQGGNPEGLFRG